MAIVGNRFYNNPAIGAAVAGLSGLFAQPDVSALPAVMDARAKKEAAMRAADLFRYAQAEDYDQSRFDRMNIAAGNYNPNASFYALDQADATKRYGIGVESADRRRGQDRVYDAAIFGHNRDYAASTENNTRDNAVRQWLGELDAVSKPLGPNESMSLPAELAAGMGVDPVQYGVTKLDQGELAVMPDGTQIRGQEKPLTSDQVIASFMRNQPPEVQNALAQQDIELQQIVDAVTGDPRNVLPADAIGQRPFVQQGSEAKPDIFSYAAPDGTGGSAVYLNGTMVDTQTGQPLPAGSRIGKTNVTGTAEETGLTTANRTDVNKQRMQLDYTRQRAEAFKNFLLQNPDVAGIPGRVFGVAQDVREGLSSMARSGLLPKDATPGELESLVNRLSASENYDPNYRKAMAMAVEMAYLQAKMQDPSGEVNIREFERLLGNYDGGLAGNAGVMPFVDNLLEQINARNGALGLSQPAPANRMRFDANGDPVQ